MYEDFLDGYSEKQLIIAPEIRQNFTKYFTLKDKIHKTFDEQNDY